MKVIGGEALIGESSRKHTIAQRVCFTSGIKGFLNVIRNVSPVTLSWKQQVIKLVTLEFNKPKLFIRGKVVEEFGVCSIEVAWMQKEGLKCPN